MKTKIGNCFILCIIFFIVLSFGPNTAHAVSGACSSHGGVNCSAQISRYDKVICNDGWTNSTVYYYESDECQASSCTPPSSSGCKTENDYGALSVKLNASGGYLGTSASQTGALTQCRNEITAYQSAYQAYTACLNTAQTTTTTYTPPVSDSTASCKKQFGQNSIISPTKTGYCTCQEGYAFGNNEQCVVLDTYCQQKYGTYNKYDPNKKMCVDQKILCQEEHGSNTIFVNNICSCATGFKMDSKWQCVSLEAKNISSRAMETAKNGSCSILSDESEKALCVDYQLHPNSYNWVVSNSSVVVPPPAKIIETSSVIPAITVQNKQQIQDTKKEENKSIESAPTTKNKIIPLKATATSVSTSTVENKITKISFFGKVTSWFKNLFKK